MVNLGGPEFLAMARKLFPREMAAALDSPRRPAVRRIPFDEAYRRYINHDYPPTDFGDWLLERDREALGLHIACGE